MLIICICSKILFLRDIDDFSFEKNQVIIEGMDINIILIMDEFV